VSVASAQSLHSALTEADLWFWTLMTACMKLNLKRC